MPGLQFLMGLPANMPELEENPSALFVYGVRHDLPALSLLGRVNARRSVVAVACGGYWGRLADDEAGRSALAVISGVDVPRHVTRHVGSHAGEWRHDDPIWEREGPRLDGGEPVVVSSSWSGGIGISVSY